MRRWNWLPLAGFLVSVAAFLSYFFFFARFPLTRDFPWLNLLFFAAAFILLALGLRRAFGQPAAAGQPERYRGRISGPIFAVLSILVLGLFIAFNFYFARQLPVAAAAPRVGAPAPDFTLPDQNGKPVQLAALLQSAGTRGALLVFYRGYW